MERRLSAIFAADMVGYSRLMEADEIGTLERQKSHRQELIDRCFEKFHGRIFKEMGDGILVEFPSVVQAVECAVEIQRSMHDREAEITQDGRIQFRIGINLGDIVVDGNDVYGDGVNVASRLETLAEPGGICISGATYDQMRTNVAVGYESMGDVSVKNISRPIRAYKVLTDSNMAGKIIEKPGLHLDMRVWVAAFLFLLLVVGGGSWWWQQIGTVATDTDGSIIALPDKPSIAVLPFDNLSGDENQQYFVDGMVEDLITDLSKVSGMFVIARNSSFAFRESNADIKAVAQALGVRHILEGSVRRSGDRVRINAQLIDGLTNTHVWADRYDGSLDDVFGLQDSITAEIINALKVVLSPHEQKSIAGRGTQSADAYDAFLRGMRILSSQQALDVTGNADAVEAFEKALKIDPNYANALAGIAWAKWLYHSQISIFASNYKEAAFKYAEDALAIQENALAHRVLSRKYYAPQVYVYSSGEPDRSVAELQAALAIEPSNPDLIADLASVLPFTGQTEKALETIKRAIRLNPDHPKWYLRPLGIAQLLNDDPNGSVESLSEWLDGEKQMVEYKLWLASAMALSGARNEAKAMLNSLPIYGAGGIPTTEYAIIRKWPLSGMAADKFLDGLRQAGFPDALGTYPGSDSTQDNPNQ